MPKRKATTRPVPTRLPPSRNTKEAIARKEKRTCQIWEGAQSAIRGHQGGHQGGHQEGQQGGNQEVIRRQLGRAPLSHLQQSGKQLGRQVGRQSLSHLDRGPKFSRVDVGESEHLHLINHLRKEDGVHHERQPQADREHRPVPPVIRVAEIDVAKCRVRVEGLRGVGGASCWAREGAGRRVGRPSAASESRDCAGRGWHLRGERGGDDEQPHVAPADEEIR
jgi:hypothetical protein